jgi:hypothetical protein
MPIQFDLNLYKNPIFIETGTYMGDGVRKALACGFETIYSIEIDPTRYEKCKKMFEGNSNVTIILGDSGKMLPGLLATINQSITFWMDAHYCADGAFIGDKWCPLHEEFEAIKNHPIKNHILLVDDWRCMDNTHIDYGYKAQLRAGGSDVTVNEDGGKDVGFPGKEKCLKIVKNINPEYKISFTAGHEPTDVLVCRIE